MAQWSSMSRRSPRDPSWRELCAELGIKLVTPADVTEQLR
jgi:hypothetical protein